MTLFCKSNKNWSPHRINGEKWISFSVKEENTLIMRWLWFDVRDKKVYVK